MGASRSHGVTLFHVRCDGTEMMSALSRSCVIDLLLKRPWLQLHEQADGCRVRACFEKEAHFPRTRERAPQLPSMFKARRRPSSEAG